MRLRSPQAIFCALFRSRWCTVWPQSRRQPPITLALRWPSPRGASASGIGYAIWYSALPSLGATTVATVQMSVPLITAIGGILRLGETLTLRLAIAAIAILGGIALMALNKPVPMVLVRPSSARTNRLDFPFTFIRTCRP